MLKKSLGFINTYISLLKARKVYYNNFTLFKDINKSIFNNNIYSYLIYYFIYRRQYRLKNIKTLSLIK
jgi:hypothetical protein